MLCINKPAGLLSQSDRTGDVDVATCAREYIRVASGKPGEAFVAMVHRLDRPGNLSFCILSLTYDEYNVIRGFSSFLYLRSSKI